MEASVAHVLATARQELLHLWAETSEPGDVSQWVASHAAASPDQTAKAAEQYAHGAPPKYAVESPSKAQLSPARLSELHKQYGSQLGRVRSGAASIEDGVTVEEWIQQVLHGLATGLMEATMGADGSRVLEAAEESDEERDPTRINLNVNPDAEGGLEMPKAPPKRPPFQVIAQQKEEIKALNRALRAYRIQMDLLNGHIVRRNRLLEQQRVAYYREVSQLRSELDRAVEGKGFKPTQWGSFLDLVDFRHVLGVGLVGVAAMDAQLDAENALRHEKGRLEKEFQERRRVLELQFESERATANMTFDKLLKEREERWQSRMRQAEAVEDDLRRALVEMKQSQVTAEEEFKQRALDQDLRHQENVKKQVGDLATRLSQKGAGEETLLADMLQREVEHMASEKKWRAELDRVNSVTTGRLTKAVEDRDKRLADLNEKLRAALAENLDLSAALLAQAQQLETLTAAGTVQAGLIKTQKQHKASIDAARAKFEERMGEMEAKVTAAQGVATAARQAMDRRVMALEEQLVRYRLLLEKANAATAKQADKVEALLLKLERKKKVVRTPSLNDIAKSAGKDGATILERLKEGLLLVSRSEDVEAAVRAGEGRQAILDMEEELVGARDAMTQDMTTISLLEAQVRSLELALEAVTVDQGETKALMAKQREDARRALGASSEARLRLRVLEESHIGSTNVSPSVSRAGGGSLGGSMANSPAPSRKASPRRLNRSPTQTFEMQDWDRGESSFGMLPSDNLAHPTPNLTPMQTPKGRAFNTLGRQDSLMGPKRVKSGSAMGPGVPPVKINKQQSSMELTRNMSRVGINPRKTNPQQSVLDQASLGLRGAGPSKANLAASRQGGAGGGGGGSRGAGNNASTLDASASHLGTTAASVSGLGTTAASVSGLGTTAASSLLGSSSDPMGQSQSTLGLSQTVNSLVSDAPGSTPPSAKRRQKTPGGTAPNTRRSLNGSGEAGADGSFMGGDGTRTNPSSPGGRKTGSPKSRPGTAGRGSGGGTNPGSPGGAARPGSAKAKSNGPTTPVGGTRSNSSLGVSRPTSGGLSRRRGQLPELQMEDDRGRVSPVGFAEGDASGAGEGDSTMPGGEGLRPRRRSMPGQGDLGDTSPVRAESPSVVNMVFQLAPHVAAGSPSGSSSIAALPAAEDVVWQPLHAMREGLDEEELADAATRADALSRAAARTSLLSEGYFQTSPDGYLNMMVRDMPGGGRYIVHGDPSRHFNAGMAPLGQPAPVAIDAFAAVPARQRYRSEHDGSPTQGAGSGAASAEEGEEGDARAHTLMIRASRNGSPEPYDSDGRGSPPPQRDSPPPLRQTLERHQSIANVTGSTSAYDAATRLRRDESIINRKRTRSLVLGGPGVGGETDASQGKAASLAATAAAMHWRNLALVPHGTDVASLGSTSPDARAALAPIPTEGQRGFRGSESSPTIGRTGAVRSPLRAPVKQPSLFGK